MCGAWSGTLSGVNARTKLGLCLIAAIGPWTACADDSSSDADEDGTGGSDTTTLSGGTATATATADPTTASDPRTAEETTDAQTAADSTDGDTDTSPDSDTDGDDDDDAGDTAADETTGEPVCDPPSSLDVLFIGNSFTFTHDLPLRLEELGTLAEIGISTTALTTGGQNLGFHVDNPETAALIADGPWDYVVIQGHSLGTIGNLKSFLNNGVILVDWIEDADAEPLLYETWARAPGHPLYDNDPLAGGDPDGMQTIIRDGYDMLSSLSGAAVVPAGSTWQSVWTDNPEIELWGPDDYHPSFVGTYLNACVFFASMTGLSVADNAGSPPDGVDGELADLLQAFADAQVQPACL